MRRYKMKSAVENRLFCLVSEAAFLIILFILSLLFRSKVSSSGVEFHDTGRMFFRLFTYFFMIFAVYDFYLFHKQECRIYKKEIFLSFVILFMISLPLFMTGINNNSDDLEFHLNRIEGIYQGLKSGMFPVKIHPFWNNGAGYATGVMYGDTLLYIPAVLRMGFDIDTAYKAYVLLINALTVAAAMYSFYHIFRERKAAVLCTFLYSGAAYRMTNIYKRAAVGEYTAMVFFPVISLALYRIYETECKDKQENKRIILWIAISMSMIIQSHILSTEMTVFCMLAVCIIFIRKTLKKDVLLVYIQSIILTAMLSLFFLVPFLDYFQNVPMKAQNSMVENTYSDISFWGLEFGDLFSFFPNGFINVSKPYLPNHLNPGLILMATLFAAWYYFMVHSMVKREKVLFFFSIGLLIITTKLFPWEFVGSRTHFGYLFTQVQFPWRYLGFADISLTLLFGELFTRHESVLEIDKGTLAATVLAVSALLAALYASAYFEYGITQRYTDPEELHSEHVSRGEYLMVGGQDILSVSGDTDIGTDAVTGENADIFNVVRNGLRFDITCRTMGEGALIHLPVFYYKGFGAVDLLTGQKLQVGADEKTLPQS